MRNCIAALLWLAGGAPSQTQPAQAPPDTGPAFRVSVTLVQIDAVVTDAKGRHVTNLKAEDFEIFQDGRPQKITHFNYVATRPAPRPAPEPRLAGGGAAPLPPPVRLRPDQVRRAIALVVDDLNMSFESVAYVRQALKNFIGREMAPGDLVAVLRTSAGLGAFQQFTTDKRLLHAAVERVRWTPFGRHGVQLSIPEEGESEAETMAREAGDTFEEFREEIFSIGTLGTINFVIRGLAELPGRKSVLLFSDGLRILERGNTTGRVFDSLRQLTDEANRASAVIYAIHARGLPTLSLTAADAVSGRRKAERLLTARRDEYFESQDGLDFMARQTGGLFFHSTNDLSQAVRQVIQDQEGYYLLGYNPGPDTFDLRNGEPRYHRIRVRLKRPGLRLRSRSGFYGIPDKEKRPGPRTREEQLAAALWSPFAAAGVDLRLTSLFSHAPKSGSQIYSLLHMDGRDFTFTEEAEGWQKAVIDVHLSTFGDNGLEVDSSSRTFTVRLRGGTYQKALENGLILSTFHPVKKPGAYQLRAAVRDAGSARVGSASQFIEVPDLRKDRLALSGISLRSEVRQAETAPEAPSEGHVDDPDPQGSPALRIFSPGANLRYTLVIFNAQRDSATGKPALDLQLRFFRDGKQIWAGRPSAITPLSPAAAARLFPVSGSFKLNPEIPPGDYVLQVVTTDRLATGKYRSADQWIDFQVRAQPAAAR